MEDIRRVEIPRSVLPPRSRWYAAHVAEDGHRSSVLSGAELQGKAKAYGGSYAEMRERVAAALAPFGVRSALVPREQTDRLGRRHVTHVRVWVAADGEPVQVVLVGEV